MATSKRGLTRRRAILAASLAAAGAFVALNAAAYAHAWSMLHFAGDGERTQPLERLSWLEKARVLFTGVTLPHPSNSGTPEAVGLAYETRRFRASDGIELEAWWIPREHARAIAVCFHGYAGTKSGLLTEARVLREQGLACLLVDHRAHGGSSGDATSIGWFESLDVEAAVAYVRKELSSDLPIVAYGQSMGGVAILRAAATAPRGLDVAAIALESVYDETRNAVRNRFRVMGLPTFLGADLLVFWGGVQLGYSPSEHNPVDYAAAVGVPVLMLHGSSDALATVAQGRRVYERLRGPKEFVEFPGAIHERLCLKDPERWKVAMAAFLDRALATARVPADGGREPDSPASAR